MLAFTSCLPPWSSAFSSPTKGNVNPDVEPFHMKPLGKHLQKDWHLWRRKCKYQLLSTSLSCACAAMTLTISISLTTGDPWKEHTSSYLVDMMSSIIYIRIRIPWRSSWDQPSNWEQPAFFGNSDGRNELPHRTLINVAIAFQSFPPQKRRSSCGKWYRVFLVVKGF